MTAFDLDGAFDRRRRHIGVSSDRRPGIRRDDASRSPRAAWGSSTGCACASWTPTGAHTNTVEMRAPRLHESHDRSEPGTRPPAHHVDGECVERREVLQHLPRAERRRPFNLVNTDPAAHAVREHGSAHHDLLPRRARRRPKRSPVERVLRINQPRAAQRLAHPDGDGDHVVARVRHRRRRHQAICRATSTSMHGAPTASNDRRGQQPAHVVSSTTQGSVQEAPWWIVSHVAPGVSTPTRVSTSSPPRATPTGIRLQVQHGAGWGRVRPWPTSALVWWWRHQ